MLMLRGMPMISDFCFRAMDCRKLFNVPFNLAFSLLKNKDEHEVGLERIRNCLRWGEAYSVVQTYLWNSNMTKRRSFAWWKHFWTFHVAGAISEAQKTSQEAWKGRMSCGECLEVIVLLILNPHKYYHTILWRCHVRWNDWVSKNFVQI